MSARFSLVCKKCKNIFIHKDWDHDLDPNQENLPDLCPECRKLTKICIGEDNGRKPTNSWRSKKIINKGGTN